MPYRLIVKTIVKPDPRKISNTLEMDPEEPIQPGFKRVLTSLGRLEDTLKQLEVNSRSSDTEVWHKPREGGKKVYCRVRCNVITVGEIDTVKQEFEAEIYLSLRWKEEHFKGKTRENPQWKQEKNRKVKESTMEGGKEKKIKMLSCGFELRTWSLSDSLSHRELPTWPLQLMRNKCSFLIFQLQNGGKEQKIKMLSCGFELRTWSLSDSLSHRELPTWSLQLMRNKCSFLIFQLQNGRRKRAENKNALMWI
ncbi:putative gamma-aminobutyric acid receptor subunit gamma-2 isoform X2 [Apostichopus japonicus]|uniref:Putative gamma-aminobutyric acid receptor subunit gamma-2 isoform X2 n=1 Tax=Stichopus japonicus TaxID=307972 RepID=A0A2G8JKJ8_STIJA|nr:putative gamma-aminobutyric acid receptor subunit gamma-2 isoform X2 [Apostichopus japonicus]